MTQLFPSWEQIKNLKVKPEPGELYLLEFLKNNLDDSYEVYFQPFLNGDKPDIILMHKDSGVLILEVKDWQFESYYIDDRGQWRLRLNDTFIKSPISQVETYKENLYYLHIDELLKRKLNTPKLWAVVNCVVYFHNETEASIRNFCSPAKYTKILGRDSLTKQKFTNLLCDLWMNKPSYFFNEKLYNSFKRYLQPPVHTLEQGTPIIYSPQQKHLTISEAKAQKILGVAGSGKTFVLAKRAVNAYKRTKRRVLILTFNITLRNYIHDRISEVREDLAWNNFYITHYHLFFSSEANNHNLQIGDLTDFEDENFFESVKDKINKYEAIFIDEIQDYQVTWVKIVRKYFLAGGGEFVVFGDEKQNIYQRELERDKRPYTGISGQWSKLNESRRLGTKFTDLAFQFQRCFLHEKYILDEFRIVQTQLDFGEESIKYLNFDGNTPLIHVCGTINWEIRNLGVHPNDVAILSSSVEFLRELDFLIRNSTHEKTMTAFETKEMWEAVKSRDNLPKEKFEDEIKKIRRGMKFNFWANRGVIKLSTIHSFKGWEVDTLLLILENEQQDNVGEEIVTKELIYTGITRCRRNLIIINIGNPEYHEFFVSSVGVSPKISDLSLKSTVASYFESPRQQTYVQSNFIT